MSKTKPVVSLLTSHFKFSSKKCPTSEKDQEDMQRVPYAFIVDSLMYAMVCTRLHITHAVGVVNQFLSNLDK